MLNLAATELIAIFLLVNLTIWILPYKLLIYVVLSLPTGHRLWITNGKSWITLKENLGLAPKDSSRDRLPLIVIFAIFCRIITFIGEIYNPNFLFQKNFRGKGFQNKP